MSRFDTAAAGGGMPSPPDPPSWQYDDRRQCGADFDNPELVQAYDESMSFRDIAGEIDDISKACHIASDSRVLELGCGTGVGARAMATRCRCLHACDISQAMLDHARGAAQKNGQHNLVFHRRGFLDPPPLAGGYDAAYSQFAFHHLNDFWKSVAMVKLHALLRPRARFYLRDVCYGFSPERFHEGISNWCAESAFAERGFSAESLHGHVRDEHSTYTWLLCALFERSGFSIEKVEQHDICCASIVARRED